MSTEVKVIRFEFQAAVQTLENGKSAEIRPAQGVVEEVDFHKTLAELAQEIIINLDPPVNRAAKRRAEKKKGKTPAEAAKRRKALRKDTVT